MCNEKRVLNSQGQTQARAFPFSADCNPDITQTEKVAYAEMIFLPMNSLEDSGDKSRRSGRRSY